MKLPAILGVTALGTVLSLAAAAFVLLLPERKRRLLLPLLLAFATGTLLASGLLGMLPHALEHASASAIFEATLVALVGLFLFERLVLVRHCHDDHCEVHGAAAPVVLLGDALHNFVDGVAIAAASSVSLAFGVATAAAVMLHEIPQEIGDFAVLLGCGYTRRRAIAFNLLSGMSSVLGALIGYVALGYVESALPYVLAVSCASFLYIALADLFPVLHRHTGWGAALSQTGMVAAGAGSIALLLRFVPAH